MAKDNYLREARQHIAVVGKFWLERENDDFGQKYRETDQGGEQVAGVYHVPFQHAAKCMKFSLYSSRETHTMNGTDKMYVALQPASNICEKKATEFRNRKPEAPKEVEIPQSLLDELRSVDPVAEKIGGRLFVSLLDSLDRIMAFWHPNFDILLSEAFVEFYFRRGHGSGDISHGAFRQLVMTPEVNTRILALMRGDIACLEDYIRSFQRATADVARRIGFTFSLGSPLDENSHISQISAEMRRFRRVLAAVPGDTGPHARDVHRLRQLDGNPWLRDLMGALMVPKHGPEDGEKAPVSVCLRDMFIAFHKEREVVEAYAMSEPMQALMVVWAFSKLGRDIAERKRMIEKTYYKKARSRGMSDVEWEESDKRYSRELASKKEGEKWDKYQSGMYRQIHAEVDDIWREGSGRRRTYTREELVESMVKDFASIVSVTLPGYKELRDKAAVVIKAHQDGLRRMGRGEELTVEQLKEQLRGVTEQTGWVAWFAAFCDENEELTGVELAEKFRDATVDHAAAETDRLAREFVVDKKKEITERRSGAANALMTALNNATVSEVTQAPAGGTSVGIVQWPTRGQEKTEADDADRELRKRQRVGAPGPAAAGPGGGREAADGRPGPSPEAGSEADLRGEEDAEHVVVEPTVERPLIREFTAEEIAPTPNPPANGPADENGHQELAVGEQNLEGLRRELFDHANLMDASPLARTRAQVRSFLFRDYVLRARRSPLGWEESSLGTHFLWRLIGSVGKSTERDISDRRDHLQLPEPDLECGVKGLGMQKVFEVDPKDVGAGVDVYVSYWTKQADRVMSCARYIAEFDDLKVLLEDLARSNTEGTITIINETLEEHAAHDPQRQRLFAAPEPLVPPGIVYVSRQAAKQTSVVLDPVIRGLFENRKGPLFPSEKKSVPPKQVSQVQTYERPYYMGCGWSFPIFIGRALEYNDENMDRQLPVISLDLPNLSDAVIFLSGLSPITLRWQEKGGLRQDEAKAIETLLLKYSNDANIPERCPRKIAWRKVLQLARFLAPQCRSKIISHGLHQRVSARAPEYMPPNKAAAFWAMFNDLVEIYRRKDIPAAKANEDLRKRMSSGGEADDDRREPIPPNRTEFKVSNLHVDNEPVLVDDLLELV